MLPLPLITFTVSRCIVHQSIHLCWSYTFSSIPSSATIPSRSGGCWITTQVLVCCLQIPDVGRRTRARHPQRRRWPRAVQGQGLGHRPHEQPQPHNDEPQGRPHTGKRERGSIVSIHLFHFISRPAISTVRCVFQDDAGVDYAGMRKSAGFAEYSALAKELGNKDLDLGSMSELGALFPPINFY